MAWGNSEVSRLRQQIEEECESLNAMNSYASVSSHETIQRCYGNIGDAQSDLAGLVGEEQAGRIVGETYIRTMK